MTDNVNHPSHYKAGGLEAIDVLEAFFPDDPLGWQVGKYILRYKKKGGLEDLQKAQVYLSRLITRVAGLTATEDPEVIDAEIVARVWAMFENVPHGVQVRDDSGDIFWWEYDGSVWWYNCGAEEWSDSGVSSSFSEAFGPFTEVLS